jgi:hypothetical protein
MHRLSRSPLCCFSFNSSLRLIIRLGRFFVGWSWPLHRPSLCEDVHLGFPSSAGPRCMGLPEMHPHRLDSGEEFKGSSHSLAGSMLRERCQAPVRLPASEPRLDRRSRGHSEKRSNSPPEPPECSHVPCHPLVQSLDMTLHRKGRGMERIAARVVTADTISVPSNPRPFAAMTTLRTL